MSLLPFILDHGFSPRQVTFDYISILFWGEGEVGMSNDTLLEIALKIIMLVIYSYNSCTGKYL
jgi:hypothetical protein